MHPEEIKAHLRMNCYTQAALADHLGINSAVVSQVIHGVRKSNRIQKAISDIIGKQVKDIWPNQYRLRRTREEIIADRAKDGRPT